LWQETLVTRLAALMEKILDDGFYLPAIGFAFRRGGREYRFLKAIFFFYPASSIQHPVSDSFCDKLSFL
jgi:hypothetical protein